MPDYVPDTNEREKKSPSTEASSRFGAPADGADDGRVVADMSALDDARGRRGLGGLFRRDGANTTPDGLPESTRDVREELGDPEERWMVILGTLRAALSIAFIYIVVFGLVIAAMLFFWRR